MAGYRVRRLKIRNFGGVEIAEHEIPPAGVAFVGRNGSGKTSRLNAADFLFRSVRAADALRFVRDDERKTEVVGELVSDEGEPLVTVARSITAHGPQDPRITVGEGEHAYSPKRARNWLEALIPSLFDPLAFFLERDAKKRRAMLLEALPVTVTVAQLREFVPEVPDGFNVAGHGLEVLERVRELVYAKRREANAKADAARDEAARAKDGAEDAARAVPAGGLAISPTDAAAQLDAAKAALGRLELQAEAAAREAEASRATRDRIAGLRLDARRAREEAESSRPAPDVVAAATAVTNEARAAREAAEARVADLERQLAQARVALGQAREIEGSAARTFQENERRIAAANVRAAEGARFEIEATRLEETLSALGTIPPAEAAIDGARAAVARAEEVRRVAVLAAAAAEARERAAALDETAKTFVARAGRLDVYVERLTKEAPAKLLASALGAGAAAGDLLAEVALAGEEITVRGVALSHLSDREQIEFAVDLAKRLAGGAKLRTLLIHRLESVDEETRGAFLRHAVAGGWQVLAALVARGDLRAEPIDALLYEADPEGDASAEAA